MFLNFPRRRKTVCTALAADLSGLSLGLGIDIDPKQSMLLLVVALIRALIHLRVAAFHFFGHLANSWTHGS